MRVYLVGALLLEAGQEVLFGLVRFDFGDHLEQMFEHLLRGPRLEPIRADPGLIATKLVLPGRGQVAQVTVAQRDQERRLEGTATLELQADLAEYLARHGPQADIPDPQ